MDQNSGAPLLISGDQQLVLSPEDAAQLLAQAGIQLGDNEQVIIGDVGEPSAGTPDASGIAAEDGDNSALVGADMLATHGQQQQLLSGLTQPDQSATPGEVSDDGTVLYIDPNDPQAAEILQQAGLRLAEDGTVSSLTSPITSSGVTPKTEPIAAASMPTMPSLEAPMLSRTDVNMGMTSPATVKAQAKKSAAPAPATSIPSPVSSPPTAPSPSSNAAAPGKQVVQVGPDQQQVLYSVTGEDGVTQQYMMLCPKDMDQNVLIQTLVKQISSDPATKGGKKTIKITQQKGAVQKITGLPPGSRVVSQTVNNPTPRSRGSPKKQTQNRTPRGGAKKAPQMVSPQQQVVLPNQPLSSDIFSSMQPIAQSALKNVLNDSDVFESVVPDLNLEAIEGTRVYVKCNYCNSFRSTLNGDTWESILNHILPVAKEEIQTSFYGDLGKHFIRSLRIQINGKQVVRRNGRDVPQCEVVLSHSLICRKNKKEFIVSNPDANFVAGLAKHIRMMQPGSNNRGNSLLCIFCNSPFTHEDYLRHIQPHIDAILATLNCFAGAYCAHLYTNTIKAMQACHVCQDNESSDLRFLPCTKFSNDYGCTKKLQFAIDCFREHYGDSGFLRLNTSTVSRCSVCKNSQQVYCAVFHISTQILGEDESTTQDVDQQLAVCVNCQKQFINIVMKEQGFDERLKLFQLKNMEQLCSVLRVILNQATALCEQKKTTIYNVHENTSNPNSAVHIVNSAEIATQAPTTKLLALTENDILASKTKVFFICDLCLFTTDLTSLVVAESDKQKNDMLLSIVLEHLVPHTESLMNVITSTAAYQTFHLKYEVTARVQEFKDFRKIIISLQKKFKAQSSSLEVVIDREEDKTISQLRAGVKAERKTFVALKSTKAGSVPGSTIVGDSSTASQLIEVNKFIERQRGKLGILAKSGCNTTLLSSYAECKLCSKFSFPDFRLSAMNLAQAAKDRDQEEKPQPIQLCENCVETVLTLCLPTEPECLQEPEECLALGEPKNMGHRLVLSNNMKKWLSLDGVNLIKKTIDDYEEAKQADCSTLFLEGLKRHIGAVLRTCQKDEDITSCAAGFCINDTFLEREKDNEENSETAAALASLEQQIGMPIKQKKDQKPKEVQVTVLARREKTKPPPPKPKTPTIVYPRGFQKRIGLSTPITTVPSLVRTTPSNGAVIRTVAGSTSSTTITKTSNSTAAKTTVTSKTNASTPEKSATEKSNVKDKDNSQQEESVSAIQSFIEATAGEKSSPVKLPAGIRITPTGKGTVNIRAVSDAPVTTASRQVVTTAPSAASVAVTTTAKNTSVTTTTTPASSTTTTPKVVTPASVGALDSSKKSGSKRTPSVVTLTANGVVRKLPTTTELSTESDEESEEETPRKPVSRGRTVTSTPATASKATPSNKRAAPGDSSPMSSSNNTQSSKAAAAASSSADESMEETPTRSKRQRKEKKIFDL